MTTLLNFWPKFCTRDRRGLHSEARSLTSKRDALAPTADSKGVSCGIDRDTEWRLSRGQLNCSIIVKCVYENFDLGTSREPASLIGPPNFLGSELKLLSHVMSMANSVEILAPARSRDWLLEEGGYPSWARTKNTRGKTLTQLNAVS